MDQRIAFVASLKSILQQRNPMQSIMGPPSPERHSPEDAEYRLVLRQIEQSHFFNSCGKHVRIRLQKWLQRLERIGSNKVWAANRNNYLKLLNLMCHCEYLTHPFLAMPPDNDPPHLPKHQITQIIDEVQREVRTSRMTSRKASIVDCTAPRQRQPSFQMDHKRFKTESNTYGQQESDTLVLRKWNAPRTFETDFEDKTISFNLSSTDKNWFSKPSELFEECPSEYQTRPLRGNSIKKQLRQITNCETRQNKPSSNSKQFKKKSKPPIYKQIKLGDAKEESVEKGRRGSQGKSKEYWESNEVTGNNSGVGTPKYLDKYQLSSEKLNDSVVIVSYREGESEGCDCTAKMLGEGWLSQIFKKISL